MRCVLARLFGGSAEDLVLRLIEDEWITPEQLDALRKTASRPKTETGTDRGRRRQGGQK